MAHSLKNQDAWQRSLEYNRAHGFPYSEHELRRMHVKWRSVGRIAKQPASLRNAENHN